MFVLLSTVGLVLLSTVGMLGGIALLLGIIFGAVAALQRRYADRIASDEGVVLRSGPMWVKTALDNYRSPTQYSNGKRSLGRGELLLTPSALVVVINRGFRFEAADLVSVSAREVDGRLVLTTEKPPGATGRVKIEARVGDVPAWLFALEQRGVQIAREG